jgi:hypothetical protein
VLISLSSRGEGFVGFNSGPSGFRPDATFPIAALLDAIRATFTGPGP